MNPRAKWHCKWFCPAAYVGYGESGPPVYSPALRHLSRAQSAAGHSAQPTGLFAGAHPAVQRQPEASETAQLVCADCQGERNTKCVWRYSDHFSPRKQLKSFLACSLAGYVLSRGAANGPQEPGGPQHPAQERLYGSNSWLWRRWPPLPWWQEILLQWN